jgi:hypothetical protein
MSDEIGYIKAFDRYLLSEETVRDMNEKHPAKLSKADKKLERMKGSATKIQMRNARQSKMLVEIMVKEIKKLASAAESAIKQATAAGAAFMLFEKVEPDEDEQQEQQDLLEEGIERTETATEKILVLKALYIKELARLDSLLKP